VLRACRTAGDRKKAAPIGTNTPQFIVGFHGQAVGPFGVATEGRYGTGN
jgi:hypothetical protein